MVKYFLISLFLIFGMFAEEKKKETPAAEEDLEITSKQLDYDHVNHKAVFTHNVKAIKGGTTITADTMTCFFDEKNDPYLIIAEGNVVILRGSHRAKSQKAVYKIPEQTIILRKSPELFDGNNTITARVITFYEDKKISTYSDPTCILYKTEKDKNEKELAKEKKP